MSFFGKKCIFGTMFALAINLLVVAGFAQAAGSVTIDGQKVLNGNATLEAGQFTFQLKKPGTDQVIATAVNDANGNIVFSDVPFSDADILNDKYVVFEISEVAGDDSTVIYDSYVGYAIVTLEDGSTSSVESVSYAKPNAEDIDYSDYEYSTYHATDDELQGVAYAVLDSRDGSLTFFRAEEGAYPDNQYVYLNGGWDDYLYYRVIPEDSDHGFNYDGEENWLHGKVKSIRFKDAVRPKYISFEDFWDCRSFDLRKLDTSRMTNMDGMFDGTYSTSAQGTEGEEGAINISGFDTSDVTVFRGMFWGSGRLSRVVWGNLDTANVTDASYMFRETSLEYFPFSRFDTTSLTNASTMFYVGSNNKMKAADFSSWGSNGDPTNGNIYDTQTILGVYKGEYLDISSWGKVYSAEFIGLSELKVVKICMPEGSSARSEVFSSSPMINVETGEVITRKYPEQGACGTYAVMNGDSMQFTNRKKSAIEIKKTDEDGNLLAGATLGLKMDGSIIYSWDTDGSAKAFSNLQLGHSYEVVELDAPEGYKKAEPISFEVSEDGVVTSNGAVVSSIEMRNEEDKVSVEKIWEDDGLEQFRPESVSFDLINANTDEKVDELTLTAANDWKGEFAVSRYREDGFAYDYKVVETSDYVNYRASYATDADSDFSSNPIVGDSVVVKNSFVGETIDYDFAKEWDDEEHEDERPESISFKLYEQGNLNKALAEASLTADDADSEEENRWNGSFDRLPKLNNDGEEAEYVIIEDAVSGYVASYASEELGSRDEPFAGANVIVNKYVGDEPVADAPDTGDKIMAGLCVFCLSLGGLAAIYVAKKR